MGYFSWLTADTKQSIPNIHAHHARAGKTVYMLQPNGEAPIEEKRYEGYGVFGGVDAYEWLAEKNLPKEIVESYRKFDEDEGVRDLGIWLATGTVYIDKDNSDKRYSYNAIEYIADIIPFPGDYSDIIEEYGKTPNDLIEEGQWIEKEVSELYPIKYPLKFSYDKNAVYEELPASEECEAQGYFYF